MAREREETFGICQGGFSISKQGKRQEDERQDDFNAHVRPPLENVHLNFFKNSHIHIHAYAYSHSYAYSYAYAYFSKKYPYAAGNQVAEGSASAQGDALDGPEGYADSPEFAKVWPCDLHVVGKVQAPPVWGGAPEWGWLVIHLKHDAVALLATNLGLINKKQKENNEGAQKSTTRGSRGVPKDPKTRGQPRDFDKTH